jgi:hypothetical protein
LFSKHASFLKFQIVQNTAEIPTIANFFFSFPTLDSQYPYKSFILSGTALRSKAHRRSNAPHRSGYRAIQQQMIDRFFHPTEMTSIIPMPSSLQQIILCEDAVSHYQPQQRNSSTSIALSKLRQDG